MVEEAEPKWEYKHLEGAPSEDMMGELTRESAFGWEPLSLGLSHLDEPSPVLHVILRRSWGAHEQAKGAANESERTGY